MQSGGFSAPAAGLSKLTGMAGDFSKSLMSGASGFAGAFNSAFDSVAGSLFDLGAKATAALSTAALVGGGAAIKQAFKFNEEMENTEISLAAIANANGLVDNMAGGFRVAGTAIRDMRKDAASLPGEFKDLENIMQTIAAPGMQMGMDMSGLEKMSAKVMTAAAVMKVPMAVAAREMSSMMDGTVRRQMSFFNRLGLGTPGDFNKLNSRERLHALQGALDKIDPAKDSFSRSWTGIKTTAIDALRGGLGAVGNPLFENIKERVGKALETSLPNSKDRLMDVGMWLGNAISNAFDSGVEAIQHWFPIVKGFAEHLYQHLKNVWAMIGPLIAGAGEGLERFMSNPQALDRLIEAGRLMVGLRMGGAGLEAGGSAASSVLGIAGSLGTIGGSEAGASALASASAAAGPLAIVLATLSAALVGLWDIVTDTNNELHGFAMGEIRLLKHYFRQIGEQLVILGNYLRPLADVLGAGLLWAATLVAQVFRDLLEAINLVIGAFVSFQQWLQEHFPGVGKKKLDNNDESRAWDDETLKGALLRDPGVAPHVVEMNTFADRIKKNLEVPKTTTHIHKVEIKVNSNQDPNRIAKSVADFLKDMGRHPITASAKAIPSFMRP